MGFACRATERFWLGEVVVGGICARVVLGLLEVGGPLVRLLFLLGLRCVVLGREFIHGSTIDWVVVRVCDAVEIRDMSSNLRTFLGEVVSSDVLGSVVGGW